jgi:hypothetical protein
MVLGSVVGSFVNWKLGSFVTLLGWMVGMNLGFMRYGRRW